VHGAEGEIPSLKQAGWKVRNFPAVGEVFFLTFPFIELSRTWSIQKARQRAVGPLSVHGKMPQHARYYWLLLAEGQLTRERFGSMLRMIAALPLPNG
jgi:hypothetical protein